MLKESIKGIEGEELHFFWTSYEDQKPL